jgi:arsenical pump membrane protein
MAFAISILTLIFGPTTLWDKSSISHSTEPPWWLSKSVYAPLLGVIFLLIIHIPLDLFNISMAPLVTLPQIGAILAQKHQIVVLILSFAYLSISLDRSDFFEICAYKMITLSKGQGLRALIYMYLLCCAITFFTSNDIVIISMTPIILYIGHQAKIQNLIPLLISQFVAANTMSMGLYIGSPTNIILGDAAAMTFLEFLSWMLLPALVAGAVTLGILVLIFWVAPLSKNRMQKEIHIPSAHLVPQVTKTMWVKVGVFIVCLFFFSASSALDLALWKICLAAAAAMGAVDLFWVSKQSEPHKYKTYVTSLWQRMPWAIAPFVMCFFVMVHALNQAGLTQSFGQAILETCQGGLLQLSLGLGFASALLVNLMNDLPSTVFWADMMPLLEQLPEQERLVAIHSLIVGVNPGCYLTVVGALAGLIWMDYFKTWPHRENHRLPTALDLTRYGFMIIIPVITMTCLAVVLQVLWRTG